MTVLVFTGQIGTALLLDLGLGKAHSPGKLMGVVLVLMGLLCDRRVDGKDEETLNREIREELSVDLDKETIAFQGRFIAPADAETGGRKISLRCYAADCTGTPEPAAEIEEIAWLGLEDIHRVSPVAGLVLRDAHARGLI